MGPAPLAASAGPGGARYASVVLEEEDRMATRAARTRASLALWAVVLHGADDNRGIRQRPLPAAELMAIPRRQPLPGIAGLRVP
jgi:hypothetical protein